MAQRTNHRDPGSCHPKRCKSSIKRICSSFHNCRRYLVERLPHAFSNSRKEASTPASKPAFKSGFNFKPEYSLPPQHQFNQVMLSEDDCLRNDHTLHLPNAISVEVAQRWQAIAQECCGFREGPAMAFLTFSPGSRCSDVKGYGPGSFYACSTSRILAAKGVRCMSSLMIPASNQDVFCKQLESPGNAEKVLFVIETPALFQNRNCLKEIYAAHLNKMSIVRLCFEHVETPQVEQWPQIVRGDVPGMLMISHVQDLLRSTPVFPSPSQTLLDQPGALVDMAADIKNHIDQGDHLPFRPSPSVAVANHCKASPNPCEPGGDVQASQQFIPWTQRVLEDTDSDESSEIIVSRCSSKKSACVDTHVRKMPNAFQKIPTDYSYPLVADHDEPQLSNRPQNPNHVEFQVQDDAQSVVSSRANALNDEAQQSKTVAPTLSSKSSRKPSKRPAKKNFGGTESMPTSAHRKQKLAHVELGVEEVVPISSNRVRQQRKALTVSPAPHNRRKGKAVEKMKTDPVLN